MISYTKEHRALAEERGHALFTVDLTGKTCKRSGMSYQGPVPYEVAEQATMFAFWLCEGLTPQAAFRKSFPQATIKEKK